MSYLIIIVIFIAIIHIAIVINEVDEKFVVR